MTASRSGRLSGQGERGVFGRRIPLFTFFGFRVGVDPSWFILFLLVTWTLAAGFFPYYFEGFSSSTYWTMGIIGSLGLFVSILLHEFSHSIVARRYGLHMKGITLFLFGGMAEMPEEPANAKTEFLMAIAGPIASVALSALFYGGYLLGQSAGWATPVYAILGYLALINLILAIFNMVPAFPLDGGRVLRSIIWHFNGSLRKASRVAAEIGAGFGILLLLLGGLRIIVGDIIGGIWFVLIGLFIRSGAKLSYQQLVYKSVLKGEPVGKFMHTDVVTVNTRTSVRDLVENYLYHYHFKMFPVRDNGRLLGSVGTEQIKKLSRFEWEEKTVGDIYEPCDAGNCVPEDMDAMDAFTTMSQGGKSRLMVVRENEVAGIVTNSDLMRFLTLKMELESDKSPVQG